MVRGFTLIPAVLLLTGLPGFGQIIIPGGGGYPGGGYPGRRYPQGGPGGQVPGPDSRRNDAATTFSGILRSIGTNNLVVESDDKSITTISTARSTKYTGASGGSAKIGDFQPGDHVRIGANQDNNHVYHAQTMTLVREGTPDEHAAASQAMNDTSHPLASTSTVGSGDSPGRSPGANDNDSSPKLRRAASGPDNSASSSSDNSSSSPSRNSSIGDDDPDRPRLRRSAPAPPDSTQSVASARDSGDPSPPQLRREHPADSGTSSTDSGAVVAVARPSLHAGDVNGVTEMPSLPQVGVPPEGNSSTSERTSPRMAASEDPFIDQTREAAFSFTETLPNYVVKQFTTRYATEMARGGKTSWQSLDTVTADVIEENGEEKYKNILVNGRPPRVDVEKTGSWSRGEFSSLQLDVLSPLTNADFHGKRATTIVNRAAFRYDFSVEQPNSHWHVESEGQSYLPAYSGSIWIDKENYRVLRIELSAQSIPRSFPLDTVESAVDYDYVFIGEGKYLLPVHSEALSCGRGTSQCSRNVIEFRNYRKFTADTSITFDPDN